MELNDTYKTIDTPTEPVVLKEKKSKFIGLAFPVENEEEIKVLLEDVRKKNNGAGHFCYAYQLGTEKILYRANDDGEPNNSAGMPIYGQIQSFDLTNILVVIVHYYGGVKLGVGGLIGAYKATAQMTLEQAEIIERTINAHFVITFDYQNLNTVMRVIKERNLEIVTQKMGLNCEIEVTTRKKNAEMIFGILSAIYPVQVKLKE